jgi:hypothetical protein
MGNQFIPAFHLIPSEEKLNPKWCKEAIDYYWYNSNVKSLLWDKDIQLIEQFFNGDIQMERFMSMFKSMKKKYETQIKETGRFLINANQNIDKDIVDIIFQAYPQIQNKVNAVVALTQKIPVEITCTAIDALAMEKREEDIQFLKNKPIIEAELQDIADQMNIGNVDLGTTKHSSTNFGDSPFGMDLNDPNDEKTFTDLMYALNVETALEEALTVFKEIKNIRQIKLLETKDQLKWAISTNRGFRSSITGLPDAEYVWPGDVYTAPSQLPDYSDNNARFWDHRMTIEELFNFLSNEICGQDQLETIINDDGGWCLNNNVSIIDPGKFKSAKVNLVYCEIKSIDSIGVYANPKSKRSYKTFTNNIDKCSDKIYGQNTYCFWWLKNTKYFFAIDKLDYAHRSKGNESYQNFSINIYKSNSKSAVELSIGQNIKSQISEIKINFAVLMAKADGYYIDIRGMRNALGGLKDTEAGTMQNLLDLFYEKNVIIADTQGFEGKNDGQFKPFIPIEGGVKNILSYLQVQQAADLKIDQIFGTNASLTGMSQNPDALIGVEKLRIDASVNALYYITEALEMQHQKLYNIWGNTIQYSIKEGGKVKDAMVNYIGIEDVNLIKGLEQTPLHNLTIKISFTQREQERAYYQQRLNYLIAQGAITLTEEYLLSAVTNPRRKFAELARIENRYRKEQEKIRAEQFQQAQSIQSQKNQGIVAGENARTDGNIKIAYAKGDVDSKLMQLGKQLGFSEKQMEFMYKNALQTNRGNDQYRKAIGQVRAKQESKLLEPISIN